MLLYDKCPLLGETLLQKPVATLTQFDRAAKLALLDKMEELRKRPLLDSKIQTLTNNIHVRIHSLPAARPGREQPDSIVRQEFPASKEIGRFLCILGTVIKTGGAKLLEYSRTYKCSVCRNTFDVEAPLEKWHNFPKSTTCPNLCVDGKLTPVKDSTGSKNSGNGTPLSKYKDYQEVKIQVSC